MPEKPDVNPPGGLRQDAVGTPVPPKVEQIAAENLRVCDSKTFPSVPNTEMPYTIQEDEIAITLENPESLPEGNAYCLPC